MKAVIATDVIFIIVAIGLIVGGTLIVFWKWAATQDQQANEYACKNKLHSYCLELLKGNSPNWNELPPKEGCENFNVVQPSEEDCKKI